MYFVWRKFSNTTASLSFFKIDSCLDLFRFWLYQSSSTHFLIHLTSSVFLMLTYSKPIGPKYILLSFSIISFSVLFSNPISDPDEKLCNRSPSDRSNLSKSNLILWSLLVLTGLVKEFKWPYFLYDSLQVQPLQ